MVIDGLRPLCRHVNYEEQFEAAELWPRFSEVLSPIPYQSGQHSICPSVCGGTSVWPKESTSPLHRAWFKCHGIPAPINMNLSLLNLSSVNTSNVNFIYFLRILRFRLGNRFLCRRFSQLGKVPVPSGIERGQKVDRGGAGSLGDALMAQR